MLLNEANSQNFNEPKRRVKRTACTVTHTYVTPDGYTETRTFQSDAKDGQKLINEMHKPESYEKLKFENDINLNNLQSQRHDSISNINEHRFNGYKNKMPLNESNKLNFDAKQYAKNELKVQQPYNSNDRKNRRVSFTQVRTLKTGCINTKSQSDKFLFLKEALDEHNRIRNVHGVQYLKLNRDLCNIAQTWAETIANSGRFEHSNNKFNGKSLGENIAMRYTSTGEELNGKQMTRQWYEEASNYNYELDFQPGKGHFAQIVWKSTNEVGFGRAQSKDGKWYAVANYFPAGNYIGKFRQNVLPPKK